jgi:hypothetical protein
VGGLDESLDIAAALLPKAATTIVTLVVARQLTTAAQDRHRYETHTELADLNLLRALVLARKKELCPESKPPAESQHQLAGRAPGGPTQAPRGGRR